MVSNPSKKEPGYSWASTKQRSPVWLNGGEVGSLSVESMYKKIKDGTEFQPEAFAKTTMVTPDTFKSAGLKC